MIKFHLSVNGPNRELFGVQTENEGYATFVAAVQEAGLDEVLEGVSRGATSDPLTAARRTVQAAFPGAQPVPAQEPWGAPPVPPFQPPQMPAAAQQTGEACQHGAKVFRSGVSAKNGKEWKAWMCPAKSADPTQCDPQFIR